MVPNAFSSECTQTRRYICICVCALVQFIDSNDWIQQIYQFTCTHSHIYVCVYTYVLCVWHNSMLIWRCLLYYKNFEFKDIFTNRRSLWEVKSFTMEWICRAYINANNSEERAMRAGSNFGLFFLKVALAEVIISQTSAFVWWATVKGWNFFFPPEDLALFLHFLQVHASDT